VPCSRTLKRGQEPISMEEAPAGASMRVGTIDFPAVSRRRLLGF
jgi:hypothetical protein